MGVTPAARRRWDDHGTVPKDEFALFLGLVKAATDLNKTILTMAERYPFLFGTESKKALQSYIKQMDKVRSSAG